VEQEIALGLTHITYRGCDCKILEQTPFHIVLTNLGEQKLRLEGDVWLTLAIPCDRCLSEVSVPMEISFDREIELNGREDNQDVYDASYIKECELDVDQLLYEEVALRVPMKILCREDCKGICSVCGANLNVRDCGCNRKVEDPRMASALSALDDYFKDDSSNQ
jgi:uncharacterized protein